MHPSHDQLTGLLLGTLVEEDADPEAGEGIDRDDVPLVVPADDDEEREQHDRIGEDEPDAEALP